VTIVALISRITLNSQTEIVAELELKFALCAFFTIFVYFDEIVTFIESNKCVLVHCYAGISRSATAVLAYLMKTRNMQLDMALTFLQSKRHVICPNFSFMGQLKCYETRLLMKLQPANNQRNRPSKLFGWNEEEEEDSGLDSGGSSSESPPLSPTEKKKQRLN